MGPPVVSRYSFSMRKAATRVLLGDDDDAVRAVWRRALAGVAGIEVVAEAGDGEPLAGLVALHRPAVVIADLSRDAGCEQLSDLRGQFPDVRVIVVAPRADVTHLRLALEAGASGYVIKDAAPVELEPALRAALAGRAFLSPRIALSAARRPAGAPRLSPRQSEILRLLGRGLATREIAARLGISVKTVETHRARLMHALQLRRGTELVRYAVLHMDQTAA